MAAVVKIVNCYSHAINIAYGLGIDAGSCLDYYEDKNQLKGLDFTDKEGFIFIHRKIPMEDVLLVPGLILAEV